MLNDRTHNVLCFLILQGSNSFHGNFIMKMFTYSLGIEKCHVKSEGVVCRSLGYLKLCVWLACYWLCSASFGLYVPFYSYLIKLATSRSYLIKLATTLFLSIVSRLPPILAVILGDRMDQVTLKTTQTISFLLSLQALYLITHDTSGGFITFYHVLFVTWERVSII